MPVAPAPTREFDPRFDPRLVVQDPLDPDPATTQSVSREEYSHEVSVRILSVARAWRRKVSDWWLPLDLLPWCQSQFTCMYALFVIIKEEAYRKSGKKYY